MMCYLLYLYAKEEELLNWRNVRHNKVACHAVYFNAIFLTRVSYSSTNLNCPVKLLIIQFSWVVLNWISQKFGQFFFLLGTVYVRGTVMISCKSSFLLDYTFVFTKLKTSRYFLIDQSSIFMRLDDESWQKEIST